MAARKPPNRKPRIDENAGDLGAGGGGSNDVTSGAGNATGIPDAELADRAGDTVNRGDPKKDREKLFPEQRKPPK